MLTVGMMWLGEDIDIAIKYFKEKKKLVPNEIEVHSTSKLLDGKKHSSFEGINIYACDLILKGCLFIGRKEDKDFSSYEKQ